MLAVEKIHKINE